MDDGLQSIAMIMALDRYYLADVKDTVLEVCPTPVFL